MVFPFRVGAGLSATVVPTWWLFLLQTLLSGGVRDRACIQGICTSQSTAVLWRPTDPGQRVGGGALL